MMKYNLTITRNDGSGSNPKNITRDEARAFFDKILQDLWNHENVRITLEREDSD